LKNYDIDLLPWQTVAKKTGSPSTLDLLAVLLLSCMCA